MIERDRRLPAAAAGFLTLAAIFLNVQAALSAGALWRDEANTVALANLRTTGDVWKNLQFDSFPVLWLAVVRIFSALSGSGNDTAFRTLGLVLGLTLIGALWINARAFGYRFPVAALALFAVAPSVIRWGDSMRAYGLGMVLILFTISAIWRFVGWPAGGRLMLATLCAILSVHTIYYNSVLLLAVCAGAVVVCLRRRRPPVAAAVIGIGFVSALSLIPYVQVIHAAKGWNALVRIPVYTFEWFTSRLLETLLPGGWWALPVWVVAFVVCMSIGVFAITRRGVHLSEDQRDAILFASVMLGVGSAGSFVFLRTLSYATQPWYYLTLLLVVAVAIDVILGTAAASKRSLGTLSVAAIIVGGSTALAGSTQLASRLTNADTVAQQLRRISRSGDVILVNPWYYGVSFERYYRGQARWQTLPAIPFHAFHRYDLVMNAANDSTNAAMSADLDDAKRALIRGSTVFVVGKFPRASTDQRSNKRPRYAAADWDLNRRWAAELADWIRLHASSSVAVRLDSKQPISRYEAMTITAVRGWRE